MSQNSLEAICSRARLHASRERGCLVRVLNRLSRRLRVRLFRTTLLWLARVVAVEYVLTVHSGQALVGAQLIDGLRLVGRVRRLQRRLRGRLASLTGVLLSCLIQSTLGGGVIYDVYLVSYNDGGVLITA